MATHPIPAVCQDCGAMWESGLVMEEGAVNVQLKGFRMADCADCGGQCLVIDGTYEFTNATLSVLTSWDPARLQTLVERIQQARVQPDARAAVEAILTSDPQLGAIMREMLIPKNAGEFWALIAALLTMITLLHG